MFIRFTGRPLHTEDDGTPAGGDVSDDFDKERALSTIHKLRAFEKEAKARLKELDDLKAAQAAAAKQAAEASGEYRRLYEQTQAEAQRQAEAHAAELAAARSELDAIRRREALAAAAHAAGYKASVLTPLAGDLTFTVRDVGSGKDRRSVAYVTDAAGIEHELTKYAAQEWPDFLPALAPQPREAPDINAGARGGTSGTALTDEQRRRNLERAARTF